MYSEEGVTGMHIRRKERSRSEPGGRRDREAHHEEGTIEM